MRRRTSRFGAGVITLATLASVVATTAAVGLSPAAPVAAAGETSTFQALETPTRLADTRLTGNVGAGVTLPIKVTGAAPLPADGTIVAAVLNVTIVGPASTGFWTIYPDGVDRPVASNINVDVAASLAGDALTLPNLVTVPVGPNGIIQVYSMSGGHMVVDMLGAYTPVSDATSGRFSPLAAPARLFDTRDTATAFQPNETRVVTAPSAVGATAVALNVTAIGALPGYWQVYPTSALERPVSSNLNSMRPGHISANQVIVPVDELGQFSVYSLNGGDLIIDVIGSFTGDTAPVGTDGLFVPLLAPTRFLDTRIPELNPLGGAKRLQPGWNVEVAVATNAAIARADVAAVALNVTVTDTFDPGYVSVTPAGSNDPAVKARTTSNLNVGSPAQTIANHAIVPVSTRGFDVFAQNATHAVADVSGYYLGAPVAPAFGPPSNVELAPPAGCLSYSAEYIGVASQGAAGPNIAVAQQRLLDLGFWNAAVDGKYGWSTQQAVMAFQKWHRLTASGRIDSATAAKLSHPTCRPTAGTNSGDLFEVDKGRQLGFFIRGGKLLWALNVSTGGGYFYEDEYNGKKFLDQAITRNGNHKVYRVHDVVRYEGSLGSMYRPRFFDGGIALHGAPNVPNYPASHGCVRISNPAMDLVWAQNLLPMGSRVWVHD